MMNKLYQWQDDEAQNHFVMARSKNHAYFILIQKNILFYNLKFIAFFSFRFFKKEDLIIVTKQMAMMVQSGLPLIDCLSIISKEYPSIYWKWLFNQIIQHILNGHTISNSFKQFPCVFNSLYCELIATGERVGRLEYCFNELANKLETQLLQLKSFKKAMRYPLFLFIATLVVSIIMLVFVLPQFSQIYSQFDSKLPDFTLTIIKISDFLSGELYILFLIGLIFYLIFTLFIKKKYQSYIDKFILKIPVIGLIIQNFNLILIFQTLAITQKSGINLLTGIHAAIKTTNNLEYTLILKQISNAISNGSSLSHAANQHKLIPKICLLLIHVGEESATLDITFEKLSTLFEDKNQALTNGLLNKIEPIMMLIMTLIIGSIVVAMYLPVFNLGHVIG